MRSIWKGHIRFSLVTIPIAIYNAIETSETISFKQLHKEDNGPIGYDKRCKKCNKIVKTEDIVKGYQYDPDKASLYTWIRTIIINNCLDFIRVKEKNIKAEELDKAEEIELEPEIISKMKSVDLLEMIRQLPTATQTVFNLYVIEGYTHKEIGQRVGISEGTSKWHLSEARKILKQLIQE